MTTEKLIISIIVITLVTILTRAVPFLLFGKGEQPSKVIIYLGKYLPPAIICAIIVYCFKDVNISGGSHGIPEFIGVISVVALQKIFHNTMISIFFSTIIYMLLVQFIMK